MKQCDGNGFVTWQARFHWFGPFLDDPRLAFPVFSLPYNGIVAFRKPLKLYATNWTKALCPLGVRNSPLVVTSDESTGDTELPTAFGVASRVTEPGSRSADGVDLGRWVTSSAEPQFSVSVRPGLVLGLDKIF